MKVHHLLVPLAALLLGLAWLLLRPGTGPLAPVSATTPAETASGNPTASLATGPDRSTADPAQSSPRADPAAGRTAATVQVTLRLVTEAGVSLEGVPVEVEVLDAADPEAGGKGPPDPDRDLLEPPSRPITRVDEGIVRLTRPAGAPLHVRATLGVTMAGHVASGEVRQELPADGAVLDLALAIDGLIVMVEPVFEQEPANTPDFYAHVVWRSERSQGGSVATPLFPPGHRLWHLPPEDLHPAEGEGQVLLAVSAYGDNGHERHLGTSADLSELLDAGLARLGPVDMVPLEPVVTGRVVDLAGRPVAGAVVSPRVLRWDVDRTRGAIDRHPEAALSLCRSDGDGRFTLPGKPGVLELSLDAYDPLQDLVAVAPVRCEAGATDVTLVLAPSGELRVRPTLPPDLDPTFVRKLRFSLAPDGVPPGEAPGYNPLVAFPRTHTSEAHGHELAPWRLDEFGWRRVPTGSYTLRVRHELAQAPGLAVEGIVVPPGAVAADPRLDPLDLGSLVHPVRLTVRSETGQALDDLTVRCPTAAGSTEITPAPGQQAPGEATLDLFLPELPTTLFVRAAGHRVERVEVDGDAEFTLVPAARAELLTPGALDLPGRCHLELTVHHPDDPELRPPTVVLEPGAVVDLPAADRVLVRTDLVRSTGFGPWGTSASRDLPELLLDVPPGDLVTLTLPITQAMVDEAAGDWLEN